VFSRVSEEPVRFTKQLQPLECVEKESVEFVCEVSKETAVVWSKNGSPLEECERYKVTSIGRVHKLTICDVDLDDEADYSVAAGTVTSTAALLVDGESLKFIKNYFLCLCSNCSFKQQVNVIVKGNVFLTKCRMETTQCSSKVSEPSGFYRFPITGFLKKAF